MMHSWEWDGKGGYWFNRDTSETLTPQQLWDKYVKLVDECKKLREALHQDGHIVIFTTDGWSIQHPVECRPDMTDCVIHKMMSTKIDGSPVEGLGKYKVEELLGQLRFEFFESK